MKGSEEKMNRAALVACVAAGAWCEIAVIVTAPSASAAICWSTNNVHTPLQWDSHTYNG